MNVDFSEDSMLLRDQVRRFLNERCPRAVHEVLQGRRSMLGSCGGISRKWAGSARQSQPRVTALGLARRRCALLLRNWGGRLLPCPSLPASAVSPKQYCWRAARRRMRCSSPICGCRNTQRLGAVGGDGRADLCAIPRHDGAVARGNAGAGELDRQGCERVEASVDRGLWGGSARHGRGGDGAGASADAGAVPGRGSVVVGASHCGGLPGDVRVDKDVPFSALRDTRR